MKINMSSWSSSFPRKKKKIYKFQNDFDFWIIFKSATVNKNSARLRCGEEISAWATICKQLFLDTTSKYSKYISLIQEKGEGTYSVYFTQLPVGIYSHSKKCEHVWHSVNVWWKQDDQHLSSNSVRWFVPSNSLDFYHKCYPIRNKQSCQLLSMHTGGVWG